MPPKIDNQRPASPSIIGNQARWNVEEAHFDKVMAELGDFGLFQFYIFLVICTIVVFHSSVHIAFVFTARDLEYRCKVPTCETGEYYGKWLRNAVPYRNNKPEKCKMYKLINNSTECAASSFNKSHPIACDKFLYSDPEITILNEFGLECDDNLWKLTLVGTVNNLGQFIGCPVCGIISDRWGRRKILIIGMFLCGIAGIIRSFAQNYPFFVVFEFFDAVFGSGAYSCGFIIGIELVGPSKRVLSAVLISTCYAFGEVFVALVSWYFKSWRNIILTLYPPMLSFPIFFLVIPESIRWLLNKGRIEEVKVIIRRAAKINKKEISENYLRDISSVEHDDSLLKVFKSPPLVFRFCISSVCWSTCAFLFYGLTLNSVALAGNSYVDFILTSLVEIPGYLGTYLLVDRIGRRAAQCSSYLIAGVACIGFIFIDDDYPNVRLGAYLVGKFGVTAAFTVCYTITSEIFPTSLRHATMAACSTMARIGSMISPQTPLLARIWTPLPLVTFAILAIVAGLLSLLFPETVNLKLPNTIEEAEMLGRTSNSS